MMTPNTAMRDNAATTTGFRMSSPPGEGRATHAPPPYRSSVFLLELEQIIECLARIVHARRGRLPLDRSARGVQRAGVALVLGRDARRNRLHALEAASGI